MTKSKIEEFEIPAQVSVFEDKKTGAKTVALPFQFQDGKNGVLMISRLNRLPWKPSESIKKITIEFNEIL